MVWRSTRARNLLNSGSTPSGQLIIDNGYNSSEQESSEGEFVEAEKPWPPVELSRSSRARTKVAALHMPRPHSHLFRRPDGRSRGSKHSRRWENCKLKRQTNGRGRGGVAKQLTYCLQQCFWIPFTKSLKKNWRYQTSYQTIPHRWLSCTTLTNACRYTVTLIILILCTVMCIIKWIIHNI